MQEITMPVITSEHHQGQQRVAPILANGSMQQSDGLDSPDHPDESGQPEESEEADRGHRGGKVEQTPAKQVFQLVRGNHQIAQEVDEEDHADSQVEVGKGGETSPSADPE